MDNVEQMSKIQVGPEKIGIIGNSIWFHINGLFCKCIYSSPAPFLRY